MSLLAGVLSVALLVVPGDYPTFDGVDTLHLNGSAAVVEAGPGHRAVLRLAGGPRERGSAWDHERIDVSRSFGTTFYAMLDRRSGAHGIAFVLQTSGPRKLGHRGRSVAVTFDDATNEVGLVPGGGRPVSASIPLTGSPFAARVTYDAATRKLRAYVGAPDAEEQLVVDQTVDLPARLGANLAWAGFTGETGDTAATQDIISWEPV